VPVYTPYSCALVGDFRGSGSPQLLLLSMPSRDDDSAAGVAEGTLLTVPLPSAASAAAAASDAMETSDDVSTARESRIRDRVVVSLKHRVHLGVSALQRTCQEVSANAQVSANTKGVIAIVLDSTPTSQRVWCAD